MPTYTVKKYGYPFIEPDHQLPQLSLQKETPLGEVMKKTSTPAVNHTPSDIYSPYFAQA